MTPLLRALLLAASLACAFVARAAGAPAPGDLPVSPGHLSVRGADILGPDGQPILLRGWNWGHWGKAEAQDADDNAAQGANVVRIPLRWWGFYRGPSIDSRDDRAADTAGIDPRHLAMLDDYVRWASRAHLWIILFIDSNCGQNGLQNKRMVEYCDPTGQYPGGHNFFDDPKARDRFIDVWRFIARRYKDTPYLGMFEPLPEPGAKGTPPRDILAFYDRVMTAIRQVAPGIPFLVGPHTYKADRVAEIYNPAWKDVVYTGNLFFHARRGPGAGAQGLQARIRALAALRDEHHVPVFVQQVGVRSGEDPSAEQLRAVLSELVRQRIGFTYWEYRGALNPDEYSAMFLREGQWVSKPSVMKAVGDAFRQR